LLRKVPDEMPDGGFANGYFGYFSRIRSAGTAKRSTKAAFFACFTKNLTAKRLPA
jgi:hypothetical protein